MDTQHHMAAVGLAANITICATFCQPLYNPLPDADISDVFSDALSDTFSDALSGVFSDAVK